MTDEELNRLADKIALAVADELDKRDKLKKQAEIARQQQQGRGRYPGACACIPGRVCDTPGCPKYGQYLP